MNLDTYIRGQVARFCIEEGARHGGCVNMLAIACCLRNRVYAGMGDWIEVVQAAPKMRATIYPPGPATDWRDSNVRTFLNRLDAVYSGEEEDLSATGIFYMDLRTEFQLEEWFKRDVLGKPMEHRKVATVGPIWFIV